MTEAALSSRVSSEVTSALTASASGFLAVGGGIIPARSLRIIFSAVSAFCSAFEASNPASTRPPAFPRSLWHPLQYCATSWFCASTAWSACVVAPAAGAGFLVGAWETAGVTEGLGACARGASAVAINATSVVAATANVTFRIP